MKENQKEKNFNQELRKKIISLFLIFVFKVVFVIISFNNTNLKILEPQIRKNNKKYMEKDMER